MKTIFLRLLPVLAWLAIILTLSAIPKYFYLIPPRFWRSIIPWLPFDFSWEQLVSALIHMVIFMVLAFLFAWSISAWSNSSRFTLIAAFGLSMGIAVGDEFLQKFVPGRSYQTGDILLDAIGALIGLCFFWYKNTNPKTLGQTDLK